MSTKRYISDQVNLKLAGGFPDSGFQVDERDIWAALEQKINGLFKLHQLDTTLPSGETIPENTMIATYEGIAVTSLGNGKATATLPIIPISLPKNVGIFLVYDAAHPDNPFIPLQRGQNSLLKADTLLNDLIGQIGFEAKNKTILFTKDLTLMGISAVTMELCVFDISQYSTTDELPIPADMEQRIVDELFSQFSIVQPEVGLVNNFSNDNQKPK